MFMTVRWWLLLRKEDILNEVDLVDDGCNTRQLVHNISYIYIVAVNGTRSKLFVHHKYAY